MSHRRPRNLTVKLLLALTSACFGLLLAEAAVRLLYPTVEFEAATELKNFRQAQKDLSKIYTIDPDFGFRPILGTPLYDENGLRRNRYQAEKSPGTRRLLFIGDSVTARAKIIEGLRRCFGEQEYEYWNAGVESFNTVQEVLFLERYNLAIQPDHVILTFHPNDYQSTPVAFVNSEGKMVVYAWGNPERRLNGWLFANSHLYRIAASVLSQDKDKSADFERIAGQIEQSLARLKQLSTEKGFELTVLIHPILLSPDKWKAHDQQAYESIQQLLTRHEIRHFDLVPVMNAALKSGRTKEDLQQLAGDPWHPSDLMSRLFALHLMKEGMLGK